MIDKLTIRGVTTRGESELETAAKEVGIIKDVGTRVIRLHDLYYTTAISVTNEVNNEQICVIKKNRKYNISNDDISITLNPRRYRNLEELKDLVNFIAPGNYEITRIDFAADIREISMSDIEKKILVPRKKVMAKYVNLTDLQTMYIGAKPSIITIYCKGKDLVRFETRLFRRKVPVNTFGDIDFYRDFDPFSEIRFVEINAEGLGPKNKAFAEKMQRLFKEHGPMNTIRKLRAEDKNIYRKIQPLLVDCDLKNRIVSAYQAWAESFFSGGSK